MHPNSEATSNEPEGASDPGRRLASKDAGKLAGAILLGVLGNAAYDVLKSQASASEVPSSESIRSPVLAEIVYVVALVGVMALFAWLVRSITHYEFVQRREKEFSANALARFFNTIAGAIVLGTTSGGVVMSLWILPVRRSSRIIILSDGFYLWNFELAAYVCFAIVTLFFVSRQVDWIALCAYGVAAALTNATLVARKDSRGSFQFELLVYLSVAMASVIAALFLVGPRLARVVRVIFMQR